MKFDSANELVLPLSVFIDSWQLLYPQGPSMPLFSCCLFHSTKKAMKKSSIFLHRFFITKKPGALPSPMPNEFGVCMVYGRCCTGCDGAHQAGCSRHFCRDRWRGPGFLCYFLIYLLGRVRWGRKAVPFSTFHHSIESFLMRTWKHMV